MDAEACARRVLPDRIWVVGPCGAGKSSVAVRLAAHLGIEPTHLDDIHWQPGWVEAPPEETAARVAALTARPRWVIDGNYGNFRRPVADRIDMHVWLDLPLGVTLPRLVRRGIVRSLTRRPCCNGNYESLWRTFLHRDSLLFYALGSDARRRRQLTHDVRGRRHVRLRSQTAIDRWLREVAATRHRGARARAR